jgi:hypothetical protein
MLTLVMINVFKYAIRLNIIYKFSSYPTRNLESINHDFMLLVTDYECNLSFILIYLYLH